jgi:phenylacetate-CoA ligase
MGLGVAVECEATDGYHFNEAGLLLEVIDPKTGEIVAPGKEGELVFTTLSREAMPLIRYRTRDISRLIPEVCPCGAASLLKFDSVRKRLDSMVMLEAGDPIYPSIFDDILFEIPGMMDYQVVLARDEGKERLELKAELLTQRSDAIPEIHRILLSIPAVRKSVDAGTMAEPVVLLAGKSALTSLGREKKLIVRR